MERPQRLRGSERLPEIQLEPQPISGISTGTMRIPGEMDIDFTAGNLKDLGPIGSGSFGSVAKMVFIPLKKEMAVKRIRYQNITHVDQERLIREQSIIMKSSSKNIVQFFGVLFHEGDCWICMELMTVSLDRLYRHTTKHNIDLRDEIIGHIAVSMIDALQYLKATLRIMHRDVKPSNVLISADGEVKLCDFGICGELKDSIVRTHDVGCQPYLSPERIQQQGAYGVRSDVWSLGITILEISIGRFPYPDWDSPFAQLQHVVNEDPPLLQLSVRDSVSLFNFISACLTKDIEQRPGYEDLMEKDFYKENIDCAPQTREDLGLYAQNTPPYSVAQ